MDRPPAIPFSIIGELRCRNCQNVVSGGPVYVVPDETILCGRCQHLAENLYRNYSFEALASMFVYPCQHWEDHCPKVLQWNECFVHENGCSYNSGCSLFWKHPKAFLKGKRDMPYGDIRLVPVPEKLLEQIKCGHCEGYLSCEPVLIRRDGTNICHRCIHSNGIPNDCIRNTVYEILSNILIFPCVFRNRGCPTRLKFGTDLWHHEAECSYNQMYKKTDKKLNNKEKGVIKTHSGHYYGTITPYSAAFAPPSPTTDFDINRELVKSLKKQQERKLLKADQLNSNFTRVNSADGSGDLSAQMSWEGDTEIANNYDKSLSSETSTPTPTRLDEPDSRYPQYTNHSEDYQNSNNAKPANNNYYENIYLAQMHQETESIKNSRENSYINYPSASEENYENNTRSKNSRDNSFIQYPPVPPYGMQEELNENTKKISRQNSYALQNCEPVMYMNSPGPKTPIKDMEFNFLAGHYPIFTNPYGQGLIPKPSFRGVVRSNSLASNKELMQELKFKQSQLKNKEAEKKEAVTNPYKECNNLEQILQVHDKISQ